MKKIIVNVTSHAYQVSLKILIFYEKYEIKKSARQYAGL